MPLDTSIPLQVKTPEFNPLQQALQVAQFRYMNANGQALQQQLDANRAVSAAYQQATDPNTGKVDNNKLMGIISQDPRAAYNMSQIAQGINTQQKQQIDIDTSKLDQAIKAQSGLRQGLGSLLTKPDLSPQDVMQFATTQLQAGSITPQVFQAEMQSMPSDPQALRGWLQQHYMSALSGETQLNAMMPKYAQVNTGPATVAVNQNPLAAGGGVGTVGYTVQNGLSPSEALAPGLTLNQNGQPTTYTKGQMAGGQVPQQPGGGYATGAPMGAQGIADDAAKRYGALQQAASQAKPMMQTYDLAADNLRQTIAGRGASAALNVPALLNTFGIQAGADKVKNNQLLVNYLNSAADQAASSLGLSGSDARLAAAKAGQPDPNNMNAPALLESIQHVKGLQQALLDRQQATTNFLAQNGNNTSQLPQFEAKWNQSFNPDVSYIRSLGDPAAQQAAMQKLKADGKLQSWMKDYQAMKALGAF
ncbi:hypothetical protein [Burkholderia metallica]|uniref:hypothetical protein n=1 Tax=Burkholderia metallica TaxID=488729 RepID=UPI000841AA48|nr:hypothetical protein [Burkholderia metallica]AOJ31424.1 hypothetical protein WJ16_07820 [Burkholderia metallica]